MTIYNEPRFMLFSEALEKLYTPMPLERLPAHLFSVVADLVTDVFMTIDDIDLATGTMCDFFSRPIENEAGYRETLRLHLPLDHPGVIYLANGGTERFCRITDFMTQREFRRTGLYQETFRPLDCEYQLAVAPDVPGHIIGLTINRDRDFNQGEVDLVRCLAPHIIRAYANAMIFSSLQAASAEAPHFSAAPFRKIGITERETEVLQWVIEGKRNAEIGIILGISALTVKKHVEHLLQKLGVETRSGAVTLAMGLLRTRENASVAIIA